MGRKIKMLVADMIEVYGMMLVRLLVALAQTVLLMALLRAFHEAVDPRVPAYGFGGCMIIVAIKIILDLGSAIFRSDR